MALNLREEYIFIIQIFNGIVRKTRVLGRPLSEVRLTFVDLIRDKEPFDWYQRYTGISVNYLGIQLGVVFYNNAINSLGVTFSSADRQPCPVCGHATGDCVGSEKAPEKIAGFKIDEDPKEVKSYQILENIVVEREIAPGVMTKIISHHKGKFISIAEAEKLGLL
jgi:hypothetical protein